ncbi:3-dehydrosphinganine reductase [Arachnomyces sp. PD_36]|nr:3-dehydrosphinganine reductase [Arachnomyces sp. PD_36]
MSDSRLALAFAALFGSIIVYITATMFGLFQRQEFVAQGRTIVITGGSDGMGRSVASQLAAKGANVVIVARNVGKLQAALESTKAAALNPQSQRFHYVSADLTSSTETDRVITEVTEWNGGVAPDVVWCCAGQCLPGFFTETSIDTLKQQMDTIYWTAAHMAHSTLKNWLAPVPAGETPKGPTDSRGNALRRHLIFTSSTLAFVPVTGYGPYSPAKAAMRALSDTLSQEVEVYNGARRNKSNAAPAADVKIHTVFPMGILSPGYENEEKLKPELTKLLEEADKPQTPEEVAAISIKSLERGDYLITTMFIGALMKASSLGVSPRNSLILDTLTSWVSSLAFLVVIPDLSGKAWKWGRDNGLPKATQSSK